MPKISVIMGVYNGDKHVDKAINSILNQSFKDFEFIICDDCSTDNSLTRIKNYALKDNRIIVLKNKKNLGLAKTLNRCLDISKGEYIARMDDDDISLVDRFKKQIDFLEKKPEYAIVGGSVNLFNETGFFGERVLNNKPNKFSIFKGSSFIHPTVMIKKSALNMVNGYTVADYTRRTEDFDLWCKLTLAGFQGYNLNDVILNYFEGKDSFKKRKFKYRIDSIKLRSLWRKKLNIPFHIYSLTVVKIFIKGIMPKHFIKIAHKFKKQY